MTEYWQAFGPGADGFPAAMPDGRVLMLPYRDFGAAAVAGLIVAQASFSVFDALCGWLPGAVAAHRVEMVVGLPTLGHGVAQAVARGLGHPNWVAAGFSRKIWYDPALSVPVASITTPEAGRRLWLDPRMLPRLRDRRVLLVDDVISSGRSMQAGLALLRAAGVAPVAAAVVMTQGDAWCADWDPALPLVAGFATPRFCRTAAGWEPVPGSAVQAPTAARHSAA